MHRCGKTPPAPPRGHVNAFLELNGVPYLLAEYLDRRNFLQLDRTMIRSEVFIDTRESMRAVIDVSIDDIGRRSDGLPAIVGNNSKQRSLLNTVTVMAEQLNHQFDVIRRGIIMRVNYQLENQRTGSVLRSMVEDLPIRDRSYFLDVNPRDINDNAVVVNFSNSLISTINEFTHGRDPMVLRITNVQMFYECLRRDPGVARIHQATPELDYYNYHEQMQNRHMFSSTGCQYEGFGYEPPEMITPPTWSMFSRYYHFDQNGHDIVLHKNEVTDPMCRAVLVPCGTVQVNRAFLINPGHRIIFKFSVWKNDVVVVSDALPLAEAIRSPYLNCCTQVPCENYRPETYPPELIGNWGHQHPWPPEDHCHPPQVTTPPNCRPPRDPVMDALRKMQRVNDDQTKTINKLVEAMNAMRDIVGGQHTDATVPDAVTGLPERPQCPPHHHHHHPTPPGEEHPVMDKLDNLEKLLEELKKQSDGTDDDVDTTEIDQKIAELEQQIADIRTHGTDEVVAEQLTSLETQITELQEQLANANHVPPQPIPEDKVNELLDKIQNS